MAKAKRKRNKQAKARRLHREPIIREVARLLETGEPTKWRWTSAAHRGLRAAMCLKGTPWALADKRAGEIVELARHRIGLSQYPSWIEARGETPLQVEYWFCAGCGGRIEHGNDRPWCSYDCYRLVYERSRNTARRPDEVAREKARQILLTGGSDKIVTPVYGERTCRGCGEKFVPTPGWGKKQRWCSRACAAKTRRYKQLECLHCAAPFSQKNEGQTHCSPACRAATHRRRNAELYNAEIRRHLVVTCGICSTPFTTTRIRAVYCGLDCQVIAARRRAAAHHAGKRKPELAEAA